MDASTAAALLVCVLAGATCQQAGIEHQALPSVVQASNAFSTSLYQTLSRQWGNIVVSPLSVMAVLSMAWLGAAGETAQQLADGLRLPPNRSQVEEGFRQLLTSLQSTDAITLNVANKIYLQQGVHVTPSFRRSVVNNFRSDAEEVDFARDPGRALAAINRWVRDTTRDKITNVVAPGTVSGNTLLLLLNAVYFKGDWVNQFDENVTTMTPFYLTSNIRMKVPMMFQKLSSVQYASFKDRGFKALRLPYQGGTASMLLLLPDDVMGLQKVETAVGELDVTHILSRMEDSTVDIMLPRFKIEKSINLLNPLQQLGITDMFSSVADFSQMTDAANIYVSKVIQKAFIEVNEKGTEAAAVTELEVDYRMGGDSPTFFANHPFLFYILDDVSGAILFMGRVMQPN